MTLQTILKAFGHKFMGRGDPTRRSIDAREKTLISI